VALGILKNSSQMLDAKKIIATGGLPILASMFSVHDEEETTQNSAALILSKLALGNGVVSQYILSNCLSGMILYHEEVMVKNMIALLSKAKIGQLTSIFRNIFSNKMSWKSHAKVFVLVQTILEDTDHQKIRQSISKSNVLKFVLDKLLMYEDEGYQKWNYRNYEHICFEFISACGSHKVTTADASVLESFASCLRQRPSTYKYLLPSLVEIVTTLPKLNSVPPSLVPVLLSLEKGKELCNCVLRICRRALEIQDCQFLGHLMDSGLLQFLSTSLAFLSMNQTTLAELIYQMIAQSNENEKYFETLSSVPLTHHIHKIITSNRLRANKVRKREDLLASRKSQRR
jgi:hypothetical protein